MSPLLALSLEVDNNMVLGTVVVGLILLAALLIGSMAVIKSWIREVAGVKETASMEISGQPIKFKAADEYLTRRDHTMACAQMERRVAALEDRAAHLEQKMDRDKKDIIDAGEVRAVLIHNRINDIDRKVAALDERTVATNTTLAVQDKKLDAILEKL